MQHTAADLVIDEAQVRPLQGLAAFAQQGWAPRNALCRRCAHAAPLAKPMRMPGAGQPSGPAGRTGVGRFPMVQPFFAENGTTPFTRVVPVGSGGK